MALLGLAVVEPDKVEGQSVVRLVKTSPLWKRVASRRLNEREFMQSASALGLGDFSAPPNSAPSAAPRDLNVLVVFMESSYNKHLSLFGSSEETQPELTRYKDRMELFPNFFSAFTSSIHARFATFTSLYPVLDFHAFTQERVPVKSLFEVLHDHGYACSMFYSSYFDYTGFRDFLKNRGLDEMYDADTMPGQRSTERVAWGLLEEETLGAIRGQLKKYAASQQRFCLTYVPAAPHYPYDKIPKAFQKHKMEELGDFKPLYLNELLYMDWVIASIIDQLKESGLLDNTLVVITNDHGEMVGGKDGHVGHGWAVTPQLANTPLILMDPARRGFQANTTIGTQVDLLPTILDRLNIPPPGDQLYEGISLDAGPAREGRYSYLNSYKEFGIISGGQVLLGDREASSPSGVASSGAVYRITNQGTATVFTLQIAGQQDSESATSESHSEASAQASPGSSALAEHSSEQLPAALETSEARKSTMGRFDAFQENLLRNYDFYSRSLRVRALTQAGSAKTHQAGSSF
jgi:arylsulfatase A-like enzyme